MIKYKYQLYTIDHVIISSESGNQFMVPSKDYIPGINILGALAGKYIRQNPTAELNNVKPDSEFRNWFVNGKISYSNAYKTDKLSGNEYVTYPLPLSIQHLKNDENKIFDLLYQTTQEQTKPFNGFGFIEDNRLIKTTVKKSTDPHHQRNYKTGAAEPHIFFNYESIDSNQSFEGTISGDDKCIEEFYEKFSDIEQLRIGRSKSTEYGRVQFILEKDKDNSYPDLSLNDDNTISLTFLSNVILYNSNGLSSCSMENLTKYLKDKIPGLIAIPKAFLKTEEVENYVSVWKLKKTSEVSFQAGSCLLLEVSTTNIDAMKNLQLAGIGERIHEGFGRIAFGLQKKKSMNEFFELCEFEKVIHSKPQPPQAPPLVKKTTIKTAEEYLHKITAVQALAIVDLNSEELRKKISSSQIGRLEGFCRFSNSEVSFQKKKEKFITTLNSLRETSKKKLNGCNFDGSNLFKFISEVDIFNIVEIKNGITIIDDLFKDVGIERPDLELDIIKNKLFAVYFLNLFSAMRKAIKRREK